MLLRVLFAVATILLPLAVPVVLALALVRRSREHPWAARCAVAALAWFAVAGLSQVHPWLIEAPCRALELKPVATLSLRVWLGAAPWLGAYALLCLGLFGGPWRLRLPGRAFGLGAPGARAWARLALVAAVAAPCLLRMGSLVADALLSEAGESAGVVRPAPPQRWDLAGLRRSCVVGRGGNVYRADSNRVSAVSPEGWCVWAAGGLDKLVPDRLLGTDGSGAAVASTMRQTGGGFAITAQQPLLRFDGQGRASVAECPAHFGDRLRGVVPLSEGQSLWVADRPAQSPSVAAGWDLLRTDAEGRVLSRSVLPPPSGGPDRARLAMASQKTGPVWLLLGPDVAGVSAAAPAVPAQLGRYDPDTGQVRWSLLDSPGYGALATTENGEVLLLNEAGQVVAWQPDGRLTWPTLVTRPAGRLWPTTVLASCHGQVYLSDNTPDGRRLRRVLAVHPSAADRPRPRPSLPATAVALLATCQPWFVFAVALGLLALSQAGTSPWQARCALEASALAAAVGLVIVVMVPTGALSWLCEMTDRALLGPGTSSRWFGGPNAGRLLLGLGHLAVVAQLLRGGLFGPNEAHMPGRPLALPEQRRRYNVRLTMALLTLAAAAGLTPVRYWWY